MTSIGSHMVECLVPSWWNCLGKIRRCGFFGGSFKRIVSFPVCTLPAFYLLIKRWMRSCSFCYTFGLCYIMDSDPLKPQAQLKAFLHKLVIVFCNSNRQVTKTAYFLCRSIIFLLVYWDDISGAYSTLLSMQLGLITVLMTGNIKNGKLIHLLDMPHLSM